MTDPPTLARQIGWTLDVWVVKYSAGRAKALSRTSRPLKLERSRRPGPS